MGAREFKFMSGYHLGPERKQQEPRNLAIVTFLCSVFLKKKIPQNTVLGLGTKNVFCIIKSLKPVFL